MATLRVTSHSEEETRALARRLASSFKPKDVILLSGPLGAGKTAFVRGLAEGLGIKESEISSPSFGMVNEYRAKMPLYHFDLYRMQSPAELVEIGWDEYLNRDGIVVVEWGERAESLLPRRYYVMAFSVVGENERDIEMALVQ